jgi:hypothetical protein
LLLATLAVVALSGFTWFVLRDVLDHEPGDADHLALIVHGVFASAATFALGTVVSSHVGLAWQSRRHLKSGLLLLTAFSLLIITGLGLYYGSEDMRQLFKWSHVGLAFIGSAALLEHLRRRRLWRRSKASV